VIQGEGAARCCEPRPGNDDLAALDTDLAAIKAGGWKSPRMPTPLHYGEYVTGALGVMARAARAKGRAQCFGCLLENSESAAWFNT
jgi:hypothetical protein